MAQLVADVLAGVLEQIRVRQIFGPSSFPQPLRDAVRRSKIGGPVSGMRREQRALRGKPNSLVASAYARARTHQERRS
jgi:uncharacterized protein (DUF2336 family)